MAKVTKCCASAIWIALFLVVCAYQGARAAVVQSVCAKVQLAIEQELTLERQAFDARLRINNGLAGIALEDVQVDVLFTDALGDPVLASSDGDDTNALFFIRIDTLDQINAVDGTGVVAPESSAEIHWLIIPSPGAGGALPQGTKYFVGARLSYLLGGEENVVQVTPDSIHVQPMPVFVLDYFLPQAVYGDDAFTAEIEPPIPFTLGVRLRNSGSGPGVGLKIDSGQPKIVENEQGLLVAFEILGSEVHGQPFEETLLVNFGDVPPGDARAARWIMQSSLSGEFVDFKAQLSHEDALGGELTSLIDDVRTHTLVHDVLVDLPGRDAVCDFLVVESSAYTVFESNGETGAVQDISASSHLNTLGQEGRIRRYEWVTPTASGAFTVEEAFVDWTHLTVVSAIRSDGKRLPPANVWFSKTREEGTDPWEYAIHLFDVNGGGTYLLEIDDGEEQPLPPVLSALSDKVVHIADVAGLQFIVTATDPNGTIPALSAAHLPLGASFTTESIQAAARGTFVWHPTAGEEGVYPVAFFASDGLHTEEASMRIFVVERPLMITPLATGATYEFELYGKPGTAYVIEVATDLDIGDWQVVDEVTVTLSDEPVPVILSGFEEVRIYVRVRAK